MQKVSILIWTYLNFNQHLTPHTHKAAQREQELEDRRKQAEAAERQKQAETEAQKTKEAAENKKVGGWLNKCQCPPFTSMHSL